MSQEVAQQPVRQSIGSLCFVTVVMTQLVLNIRLANDELGLDNLWRRWRNAVVQRTDVCSYYLEESIHAISQCMDVTLVELICKAGHRGARLLASDELMLRRQNARVTVPQSSILRA